MLSSAIPPLPSDHPSERIIAPPRINLLGSIPPSFFLVFSIFSIQVGSALAVVLFGRLSALGVTFLKVGFSAFVLCAVSRPFRDPNLRRHLGLIVLFGLDLAVMFLAFYEALARIPMGVASTIGFIGPLAVAVFQSRKISHFLWIALTLAGVVLLTPQIGAKLDPVGVGLAALAAVGWAAFVVLSKRIGRALPNVRGLAAGMAAAALMLTPFAFAEGAVLHAGLAAVFGGLAVAILSTIVPLSLEFSALQRLSARTYGILMTLEPAVSALVGGLLLGQALGYRAMIAISLVTAASFGASLFDREDGV